MEFRKYLEKLRLDKMPERQKARIRLMQGSLIYRDNRLNGYDAAVVAEVIEHLDPSRLAAFERVLFEFAVPDAVVMTTPNIEYNVKLETLQADKLRHNDHRFEWTRKEFQDWSNGIAGRYSYSIRFLPIGPEDPEAGSPTQMAVFERVK
jgi:3' terminal RNA ribose 2'-O-methyltransferase Hen1